MKPKRNTDLVKGKKFADVWEILGKAKFPRILRPLVMILIDLENIKDFFEKNHKIVTIFGVFAALSVYSATISLEASYIAFMLFLLVGVILLYETMKLDACLLHIPLLFLIGGLVHEVYNFIGVSYSGHLNKSIESGIKFLIIIGGTVLLNIAYYRIKPWLKNIFRPMKTVWRLFIPKRS